MKPKIFQNASAKKEMKKSHTMAFLAMVLLSFLMAMYTISSLGWEDRISMSKGFSLFGLGFIFFTSLYYYLNNAALKTAIGSKLIKKYKLSQADVLDTSNKIVSAVQALFSCISGAVISLYSCPRDLLKTSTYISEAYAWFGASYFFYDIWSMYKVHCASIMSNQVNGELKQKEKKVNFMRYVKNNPIIVGHHLFIGGFGFLVITYLRGGLGDCVFGFVYFMEFSTPFVSLRGILSRFGLKNTKFYVINGLTMLGTFFLCRIAMFPYVIYLYASVIQKDILTAIISLPRGCKISILILVLPQIYWFGLMVKGAKAVLKPKPQALNVTTHGKKKRSNHNTHA